MAEISEIRGVRPTYRKGEWEKKEPRIFSEDPIEIYNWTESEWLPTEVTIEQYDLMTKWEAMYLKYLRISQEEYYNQLVKENRLLQTIKKQGERMQRTYEQQLPALGEWGAREMAMDMMY